MFEGGRGVVVETRRVAVDAESVVDTVEGVGEGVEVDSGGGGGLSREKPIKNARNNSRITAMAARLGMGGL